MAPEAFTATAAQTAEQMTKQTLDYFGWLQNTMSTFRLKGRFFFPARKGRLERGFFVTTSKGRLECGIFFAARNAAVPAASRTELHRMWPAAARRPRPGVHKRRCRGGRVQPQIDWHLRIAHQCQHKIQG